MNAYTTERVTILGGKECEFLLDIGPTVTEMFGGHMDWTNFNFSRYAENHHMWFCSKGSVVQGMMMAQLFGSVFDSSAKILRQDLLYCKKSSGRAAYLLMQEFIAFGRGNANLVFTCLTKHTNVKERTLNKLGFQKIEEIYSLEVK